MIGFGENSHLIPFINQSIGNVYPGHKSVIMVNPAPPKFIRYSNRYCLELELEYQLNSVYLSNLKETGLERFLGDRDVTRGIYKRQIMKKLVKLREKSSLLNDEQLFNTYLSYKEINEKLVNIIFASDKNINNCLNNLYIQFFRSNLSVLISFHIRRTR